MRRFVIAALSLALSALPLPAVSGGSNTCSGAFPNLITDICWDCMFPMTIGGMPFNFGISGADYDTGASKLPVCLCIKNLFAGTPIGFWEPRYMVDVTPTPGCMPLLGGVNINPPMNGEEYGAIKTNNSLIGGRSQSAFMQLNEYVNPVMTALGVITQTPCLDNRSFDVPYISWADPTWGDDSLAMILTPYAYPFAGIPSVASESPDAIAATAGFPFATLFWVAGSWGPMYPLTGNVAAATTQEQVAHLLVARILAKFHAAGTQQTVAGQDALQSCGAMGVPQLVMDKRQYKTSRTYPFSDNLCTPIGRPLAYQELGSSRPQDKDYGYFIFQRKDCCAPLT